MNDLGLPFSPVELNNQLAVQQFSHLLFSNLTLSLVPLLSTYHTWPISYRFTSQMKKTDILYIVEPQTFLEV